MNIIIYIFIFIAKIIENTLSTLRIIVIAKGKKLLGAFLNLIVCTCWLISTSIIITNINDWFKIISYIFGSFIGSYLGSYIYEKSIPHHTNS
jgi:uncharacterized protein YebE (UPF0316 family)